MKLYACPYIERWCSLSKPQITALLDETQTISTSSKFDATNVCYYEISAETIIQDYTKIHIQMLEYQNVVITVNQGETAATAEDSWEVGTVEGTEFELTANQTVWITILAFDEDPLAKFEVTLIDTTPEPIEVPVGDPWIPRPILSQNVKLAGETPPTNYQPQIGIYVLMFTTMAGIFSYLIFNACVERCNQRKQSLAVATTHLTDRELMPLEEQLNMLEDESKMI